MRRLTTFIAGLLVLTPCLAFGAKKADVPKDLYNPQRLTAGAANQFMGSMTENGDALYFVSDANVSTEVFVQSPVSSGARLFFDESADVGQPQISPDGSMLAYISYRADSTGDVCVRDLKEGESWCKTGLESADLQVQWAPNGKNLLILKRDGINGSMRLVAMSPKQESSKEALLLEKDMLRPVVHPKGDWFAYVPLSADSDVVGVSFSQKAIPGIALHKRGGKTLTYSPGLPGTSSLPAFGADGKMLYFVQYLNDTNGDGQTDGDDNAVVFRVPFDPGAKDPTAGHRPVQLTSAQWSCMYPNPREEFLLLTCSRGGTLDVYSLPLSGMVPEEWDSERIRGEAVVARDHWTRLLLLGHLYGIDPSSTNRVEVMREMLLLHLELREYASASFYADHVTTLAGKNKEKGIWGRLMKVLVIQRELEESLVRGLESGVYVERARKLKDDLDKITVEGDLMALSTMIRGEIIGTLGMRSDARSQMDQVEMEGVSDSLTIQVIGMMMVREFELEGDHDALLDLYNTLSHHPKCSVVERLMYSDRFVRELFRGQSSTERISLADTWLGKLDPTAELAMTLSVHRLILDLNDVNESEIRKAIFNIYKANKDKARRKALVLATVKAASERNNEMLQYQFTNTWASGVKRAHPERKYAERLFQEVVLERAYIEWSKGEMSESRGYFFATTMQTGSLEAHIGFIEAWIKEGREDIEGHYKKQFKRNPEDPVYKFVQAYLKSRTLSQLESKKAHGQAVEEALALLGPATEAFPRSAEVQHLWGTLLHQQYLRQGKKKAALNALPHYLLAQDLAQDRPRYLAVTTQQLGLLQASMGNHRLALSAFEARVRLPFPRPEGKLNLQMAMARSLFYVGRANEALDWLAQAEQTVEEFPQLAQYELLLLDRRGLYAKEVNRWEDSVVSYQKVHGAVSASSNDLVRSPLNRLKAKLGEASAQIGGGNFEKALVCLDKVDGLLAETGPLRLADVDRAAAPVDQYVFDRDEYRLVALGLRARANYELGRFSAATRVMTERRDRIAARFEELDLDEDLLDLAVTQYHLANYAVQVGDNPRGQRYLEEGLKLSGTYNERTGSGTNDVGRRLLQAYAELHLFGKVSLSALGLDLREQLEVTYGFMCENPSPTWESDRFLLGVYLTMLESGS